MRRVANALDTGAASLYVYVKNRDELRGLMFDRVAASVPVPVADPATWRAQIQQLCGDMRAAMEAHPGIAAVALARIPLGPGALRAADGMIGILLAGGISPQHAAWAADNLSLIVTATAVETDIEQLHGGNPSFDPSVTFADIRRTFQELSPDEHPHLQRYAIEVTSGDDEVRFRFAIDTYLDGLIAQSAADAPSGAA